LYEDIQEDVYEEIRAVASSDGKIVPSESIELTLKESRISKIPLGS
jgi:hypothetical protein